MTQELPGKYMHIETQCCIGTLNEADCTRNYNAHIKIQSLANQQRGAVQMFTTDVPYVHNKYTYIRMLYIQTENDLSRFLSVYCCSMYYNS